MHFEPFIDRIVSEQMMGADVADFRPPEKREWNIGRFNPEGMDGPQGLYVKNTETGKSYKVAFTLHIPKVPYFYSWTIRGVTALPEDQIIFQLGGNQIVILDLNTRNLSLIVYGYNPIVGYEN